MTDAPDAPTGPVGAVPAAPPGGWPAWFDPSQDLLLTPRRLRALAHPIRVRLLILLESDGPATASELGRRIGQSSGVTSYHLRILGELGYLEEDPERGNGRDRYWRTRYRNSGVSFRSPDDPADPQSVEAAEQFMRVVADTHHERALGFVHSLTGRLDELSTLPWTLSAIPVELTYDEARALSTEVNALLDRYRRDPGQAPRGDGAVRAIFQYQMLPDAPADAPADRTPDDPAGDATGRGPS